MARVRILTAEESDPSASASFEWMQSTVGMDVNLYAVVAHRPDIMATFLPFAETVMGHAGFGGTATVDDALKELVVLRVSRLNACPYCVGHHLSSLAAAAGNSAELIDATALDPDDADVFDDRTRSALRYASVLTTSPRDVGDEVFAPLREHFDEQQIVELTMTIALFNAINRIAQGLDVELESGGSITFE